MEKVTITVAKVAPAVRKDGSIIDGIGKAGKWVLWKVISDTNQLFTLFCNGTATPPYEVGQTYEVYYEQQTKNGYTDNRLIPNPKKEEIANDQLAEMNKTLTDILGCVMDIVAIAKAQPSKTVNKTDMERWEDDEKIDI